LKWTEIVRLLRHGGKSTTSCWRKTGCWGRGREGRRSRGEREEEGNGVRLRICRKFDV